MIFAWVKFIRNLWKEQGYHHKHTGIPSQYFFFQERGKGNFPTCLVDQLVLGNGPEEILPLQCDLVQSKESVASHKYPKHIENLFKVTQERNLEEDASILQGCNNF